MKPLILLLVTALTVSTTLNAAEPAAITLTLKSYRSLTNLAGKVVDSVHPGAAGGAISEFGQGLGISELKGIDLERPWQVAFWVEGIGVRPDISLWIPTKDYAAFVAGISEGGFLRQPGQTIQPVGSYAAVWIPAVVTSDTAKSSHAAWKADQIGTPDRALNLQLALGEPLRQQVLSTIGMVKMAMPGALAGAQQAQETAGLDPKALVELLGVYFDVFEVGVKGLRSLDLAVDLGAENLLIRSRVNPAAGSELGTWFQGTPGTLDSVMPFALGRGPAAFAMSVGQNPAFMPILKKVTRLSLQMQGIAPESDAAKETERLLDLMLPVKAAGVLDFDQGISFAATYEFPGRNLSEFYGLLKKYVQTSMQVQVGEGKPYKSVRMEEAKRQIGGVSIDRASMEFNLEAPLYKAPGQREMIESLFPGGKMEVDYALKGDRLFFATPARMEPMLANAAPSAKPPSLPPNSIAWGRVNILQLLPRILNANPMVPEDLKRKFQSLDAAGTDITFTIALNGTLASETALPLKLLQSASQLHQ